MSKADEQDTDTECSTEAGLTAGAGDIGKESFEIFNGVPDLSCEFHPNGCDTCWLCIKNQFAREGSWHE